MSDDDSILEKKKVLLVDDVNLFLQLEETFFKRKNCIIMTANSGEEALEIVKREKPNLIVLDLIMPGIHGDEVCRRIKSEPKYKDIPIIMVSRSSKPEDIENCIRAGCDHYITKPIKQTELLNKAAELMMIPIRKSMRIFVKMEVEGKHGKDVFFGNTENISLTGIFVICEKVLKIDSEVTLKFFLPGTRDEVSVTAKVMREDIVNNKHGYGLHFTELKEEDRKKIETLIKSGT